MEWGINQALCQRHAALGPCFAATQHLSVAQPAVCLCVLSVGLNASLPNNWVVSWLHMRGCSGARLAGVFGCREECWHTTSLTQGVCLHSKQGSRCLPVIPLDHCSVLLCHVVPAARAASSPFPLSRLVASRRCAPVSRCHDVAGSS